VIGSTLMVAGWSVAVGAIVALGLARRALGARCKAVAEACHELRGPLTAVLLGLEPADRQGGLSPARIRAIELELARAALAVEDLESVRSGRPDPDRAELVDVCDLLADSVEAWRASAARRGVGLRVIWSGPRALVTAHRLRLAQATGNLIANANAKSIRVSGAAVRSARHTQPER
jgi:signal transduction histidine kinase